MSQPLAKRLCEQLPELRREAVVAVVMATVLAFGAMLWFQPTRFADRGDIALKAVLPSAVGAWTAHQSNLVQMSLSPGDDRSEAVAATYDDTAMATYVDESGPPIMVALAYGRVQRQESKIHRPELCYSSQGYEISRQATQDLPIANTPDGQVTVNRMEATHSGRREIVSYWIRIGDLFSAGAVTTRVHLLKVGLLGEIPDGILFRVSQVVRSDLGGADLNEAYTRQERFMTTLSHTLQGGAQKMLIGDRLAARLGDHHATP